MIGQALRVGDMTMQLLVTLAFVRFNTRAISGVLLIVFLLSGTGLYSEAPSGVRGRIVYQQDHLPIRSGYVVAHPVSGNGESDKHTRGDPYGLYELQLLPGIYDVMISAEGYAPTCRKIEVTPDGMMMFNAALEASDVGANKD